MNSLFKERLLKVGKNVGFVVLYVISVVVFGILLYLLTSNFEEQTKVTWLILLGILLLYLLIITIINAVKSIIKFIKWLFVEPFKNDK